MPEPTERLRRKYKPRQVRFLLVGESPPSGETFFYAGNSRLCSHTQRAFERFLGTQFASPEAFLRRFKALGFYLEDLCVDPVNGMKPGERRFERDQGIPVLATKLRSHKPKALLAVMKGIAPSVLKAAKAAGLEYAHSAVLPFPAHHHGPAYESGLLAELRLLRRRGLLRAAA